MENNSKKEQPGKLLENAAVRRFLRILMGGRPAMGQDYSMVVWQADRMEDALGAVQADAGPEWGWLRAAQADLDRLRGIILENAREAVEGYMRAGVKALDGTVPAPGLKSGLERIRDGFAQAGPGMGGADGARPEKDVLAELASMSSAAAMSAARLEQAAGPERSWDEQETSEGA